MGNWSSKSQTTTERKTTAQPSPSSAGSSFTGYGSGYQSVSSSYSNISGSVNSSSAANQTVRASVPASSTSKLSTTVYKSRPAPVPPVPKVAYVDIKFDANNYLIPNVTSISSVTENVPNISVPYRSKVDKFSMRVCPQYNSKKGCYLDHCYRFHICVFWAKEDCKRANCLYDHSFHSSRNQALLTPLLRRNFGEVHLRQILKKGTFLPKTGREMSDYICTDNIVKQCNRNPCNSQHRENNYVWEINLDSTWVKLTRKQNMELEKVFSDPKNLTASLSKLPHVAKPSLLDQALGDEACTVNFETLSLVSRNTFYRIRRLSTPSDIMFSKSLATRWLWYWQNDNQDWYVYKSGTVGDYFTIPLSDFLEFQYLKGTKDIIVKINDEEYNVNFESMIQVNNRTSQTRSIARRPAAVAAEEKWHQNTTFHSLWSKATVDSVKHIRSEVSVKSPEYLFVRSMILRTMPSVSNIRVERIENPFKWQSFQLKKSQMLDKYNGNSDMISEQYLFHGTRYSVIDKICDDSFDWRLFGTNVGNVYGQGVYFANSAALSNSYASYDHTGSKCMFIVVVLVGSATVGNSSMTIPPLHPVTKKRFDTTVNTESDPSIFVKYNLDEYYPVYFVRYT